MSECKLCNFTCVRDVKNRTIRRVKFASKLRVTRVEYSVFDALVALRQYTVDHVTLTIVLC